MKKILPKPNEVNINIPPNLNKEKFKAGFEHGLKSNSILNASQLQKSFAMGFREAKMYLKQLRKEQGITELPITYKFKLKTK